MPINERLMAKWKVNGHSTVVWHWSGDPMVPRSNPLLVKKFLLLSLLIWKGGFEILPNNTWDLLKKAYGTSKKLRFQFRGQLNKPFSEPTYLYTNLIITVSRVFSTAIQIGPMKTAPLLSKHYWNEVFLTGQNIC